MGMVALGAWRMAPPPRMGPTWQALSPVPLVPETVRPSGQPPSMAPAPDAILAPEADDAPTVDGP